MGDFDPSLTFLLLDIVLDRQSMAIPARDVRRVETAHRLCFNHEVFERLVDRMTQVEFAIGVGRAIMKYKFCLTDILVGDALIDIELLPASEHFWFALRKTRLHGKFGERQVEGCF